MGFFKTVIQEIALAGAVMVGKKLLNKVASKVSGDGAKETAKTPETTSKTSTPKAKSAAKPKAVAKPRVSIKGTRAKAKPPVTDEV